MLLAISMRRDALECSWLSAKQCATFAVRGCFLQKIGDG